ncbi:MAG: DUF1015 domain-containing protein [Clostridia bacterium]|nr:DUF1015 domain-containing protein [Clostridia bacterium]
MSKFEKVSLFPADILLPKDADMNKWSVVACDQYTSQPEYWEDVKNIVADNVSAYNLVLPELYLNGNDVDERIKNINVNMQKYLDNGIFAEYKNSVMYIERTLNNGKVRKGIVASIDLEDYKFEPGNTAMIRATEGTVLERIPPRVKVRENACLKLPHVMLLIDDADDIVFGSIDSTKLEKFYDFELMKESGHLCGWKIDNCDKLADKLAKLYEKNYAQNNTMLYAVGDGNHSLATAKACWEKVKKSGADVNNHPARYALVEIENIHDNSLDFEPIHRIIINCDADDILKEFDNYCGLSETGSENDQQISSVVKGKSTKLYIKKPTSNLAVGTLQNFLDKYISNKNCEIDYIHGDNVVADLSMKDNSIGFLLPSMEKSDLFRTIIKDGILPRKTFSMGEACDKRFYVEARKIK